MLRQHDRGLRTSLFAFEIVLCGCIFAVTNGYLDEVDVDLVRTWELGFHDFIQSQFNDVLTGISQEQKITEDIEGRLRTAIEEFNKVFEAEHASAGAA